ncbi:MAG: serine/threonine protein kinase [Acidimicrobiales bacterium]|nr:serine/threonine protein kinase [Acidimicrobiales bacterium]
MPRVVRRRTRPEASPSLLPGYTDLTEIGGGAFATVYRAKEVETGREVALKVLKVDTVHPHLIETFQREIQALAKVSDHPNIVTLYRPLQTPDGRPVLVLELCRHSLSHQIRTSGPLGPQEATQIGIKIAGALETAHRHGFLHRDMKPQNILITSFGEPALADFGVAALQASAQATVGVFGFTTLHAAPEMLEGHHLSPATDVYGLASTMYQLLAGRAPFAAFENEAPASVILRVLRDPVRPLYSEEIPLDLSDLLETSLSKEPEGRPRSALEFAGALQSLEAAQGWPATSHVAWGDAGWSDAPGDEPEVPIPERHPGDGPGAKRGRGERGPGERGQYQGPPSVHVAGFERPARPLLPPLLPASHPADTNDRPSMPADPVRPSVVPPAPAVRNVVAPGATGRGQPGSMAPPPADRAAPPANSSGSPSGTSSGAPKPIFLDPVPAEAANEVREGRSKPADETTRDVGDIFGSSRSWAPSSVPSPERNFRDLPPFVMVSLGFAAVVVIAAVLLLAGVI